MIKKLKVVKLNDIITDEYHFNSDLNILSGKNGCGKTTLMKLMWYMLSGNLSKLFDEISFEYSRLDFLDEDYIELIITNKDDLKYVKINTRDNYPRFKEELLISQIDENVGLLPDAYNSLFFPTFRRIEGGFSTTPKSRSIRLKSKGGLLKEALENISDSLSFKDDTTEHLFIASISTTDIKFLISKKYAEISEGIRKIETAQSKDILNVVSNSRNKEKESLNIIREIVKKTDAEREETLKPFTILSEFISNIFKNKSIQIVNNIILGNAEKPIISENLSAGEKQMLSFLCYNFFFDNTIIFIDEPELSLHTDWQRILFPTLLKQGKQNQFIIATHSPFIYSKYPDKEIMLDVDRGENDE